MKIDKTMLLLGGAAAAVGLYFLWPKIKENFSFNTVKAYPVPGNPSPEIINGPVMPYPVNPSRYDPNLGHGPHLA